MEFEIIVPPDDRGDPGVVELIGDCPVYPLYVCI
jgi:hypothetical protein